MTEPSSPESPDPAEELEQLWRLGRPPNLQTFLRAAGELPPEQIAALLRVDQRERWRRGERVPAEAYLALCPALGQHPDSLLDLVYGEFLVREQQGEEPTPEEFVQRFPLLGEPLKVQIELHRAMQEEAGAGEGGQILAHAEDLGDMPAADHSPTGAAWPEVAGYEILGELGQGGMGLVYKAWQHRLKRLVALKMLRPGVHTDAEHLARFRVEAEAVSRLQHPNIVQIYDVGEQDGRPFIVLEWVEGGGLDRKLAGEPQPPGAAAQLVRTFGPAGGAPPQPGVFKSDLKPANVLLKADGTPKITDFGLAKLTGQDEGEHRTQSGAILGTASYMAPEQATGRARAVSPAIDVYALGAILYEMLTGRPPFKGATVMETLDQVRHAELVPPSRLGLNLPQDLRTICQKCLEKEASKRYATAQALADDLRRFLEQRPIHARRIGPAGRAWRWCRRNPVVAGMAVAVAFLLLVLAGGATLAAFRLEAGRRTALRAEQAALERLRDTPLARARPGRWSGQAGQRFESLQVLGEAAAMQPAPELRLQLRREASACLALVDLQVRARWEVGPVFPSRAAFDPSFERYALGDEQGRIRIWRTADRRLIDQLGLPAPADYTRLQFSADGRFLAAAAHSVDPKDTERCLVWEVPSDGPARQPPLAEDGHFLGFSADSRYVVVGRKDGVTGLYNLVERRKRLFTCKGSPGCCALHPDGRHLAYSRPDSRTVRVEDLETGTVRSTFTCPANVDLLTWSPEGQLLAAACGDHNIYVWSEGTSGPRTILQGHHKRLEVLAFNPSGSLLASSSLDGTTRLWDPLRGKAWVTAPGQCLGFRADGRRLAFQLGSHLGIWEVADGAACRQLQELRGPGLSLFDGDHGPECLAFSPDGRLLVTAGGGGLRWWDTATGRQLVHLTRGRHETVLFHPRDGRLFSFGRPGLTCWPIRTTPGPAPVVQVGPAQVLPGTRTRHEFRAALSQDGRLLAMNQSDRERVLVFPVDRPQDVRALADCRHVLSLALSPDGRWAAAGVSSQTAGVKVWDTSNGRLVHQVTGRKDQERAFVGFSPDGRWLATGGNSTYRLYRVGSWELGPVFPRDQPEMWIGPLAFSPDGRLLALTPTVSTIRLMDLTSGQEITTLAAPEPLPITWLTFSPDGSRLAAAAESSVLQIWDLRKLRGGLHALGLDWELPPYPPDRHPDAPPQLLRLEVLHPPAPQAG